ncbi:cell division protein FtsW [Thalassotalea mangrovi]|uniref:Probable peptidoglycan glycosyltransferase FtsW n=1 Tax=Thalassotalea mangrovi TaxID=2572245 RepID=A0A4U1BAV9_9GAMM|nr:cell division protein FtsW [Thalassotalea mangrovi]TKB47675.1 cell division protein FtsW [Thalassotalea mangrovi]
MSKLSSSLPLPVASWGQWLSVRGVSSKPTSFDRGLLLLALCLYLIGMIMVASSSMPVAERLYDNPFHFVLRHGFYILVSLCLAAVALNVEMKQWHQASGYLLLLAIALLVAVLIIGRSVNGSTRWIALGPFNIQAAEPAKLFFFCYLSAYLVRKKDEIKEQIKGFFKPLLVLGLLGFLLLMQPDLGTAVVMFITTIGLLFLAGAKLWQFLAVMVAGFAGIAALVVVSPYRWRRITAFMEPWERPFDEGYQLTQSLMAYGRGETFGQGLGNSIQKLEYLPEAHTDFVMAVIGEEFGFIGILAILLICLTLVIKALLLGNRALMNERYFEGYFAYAIGIWMSFQIAVNVGASSGVFPTKGLTMPLISYGGSSMLVMTLAIVVLMRIDFELRMLATETSNKKGGNDD